MYIVDKKKDYYDYISNQYGIDYNKKFERHSMQKCILDVVLYFNNEYYMYIEKNVCETDRFSYFNKYKKYISKKNHKIHNINNVFKNSIEIYENDVMLILKLHNSSISDDVKNEIKTIDKPYFIFKPEYVNWDISIAYDEIPNLSLYNFGKIKSAEEVYVYVDNYIQPKQVEIDNNPDNMIRYEQKGFDKKTSFRNIK